MSNEDFDSAFKECDSLPENCTYESARGSFAQALVKLGIDADEARREAEIALQHVCQLAAHQLLLKATEIVPASERITLGQILEARQRRVPLQYALGETYFAGLKFAVGPGVLIPRNDTEVIVSAAAGYLSSFAATAKLQMLEVGAGSGAIVISLLKRFANLKATAFEISPQAAHFCRINALCHGVSERLTLIESDYLEGLPRLTASFDLFVSNPPYIPIEVAAKLAPEVIDHEPSLALIGGTDGMDFYRHFARLLPGFDATARAALMIELGIGQAASAQTLFVEAGWSDVCLIDDLNGVARVLTSSGWRNDDKTI